MAINWSPQLGSSSVLMSYDHVELSFGDMDNMPDVFKDSKKGSVFLMLYQVVFVTKDMREALKSFTMPFYRMKDCEVKQPMLGANYIKGIISAESGGGWEGSTTFKLTFTSGGAIEFGQKMLHVASQASRGENPENTHGFMAVAAAAYRYMPPMDSGIYPVPFVTNYPPPPMGYYPGPPLMDDAINYMPPPPPYPGPMAFPSAQMPSAPAEVNAAEVTMSGYNSSRPPAPREQPPPYSPTDQNQRPHSEYPGSAWPPSNPNQNQ